ncbi:uncharacterized protein LOC127279242 [Leptopilina boulardi]|uniref:uncharacterized protein LOC127279242 n=1 Tax=Leptopilina boulardi TaxID=63433 RepID=UPI0021F6511F|nr:uncharacterized protein LOC127279242 [Leptopilina boulardi]
MGWIEKLWYDNSLRVDIQTQSFSSYGLAIRLVVNMKVTFLALEIPDTLQRTDFITRCCVITRRRFVRSAHSRLLKVKEDSLGSTQKKEVLVANGGGQREKVVKEGDTRQISMRRKEFTCSY